MITGALGLDLCVASGAIVANVTFRRLFQRLARSSFAVVDGARGCNHYVANDRAEVPRFCTVMPPEHCGAGIECCGFHVVVGDVRKTGSEQQWTLLSYF
jgi:hypothetical protein